MSAAFGAGNDNRCRVRRNLGPIGGLKDPSYRLKIGYAATGVTTAELMRRAGHASADAVLRYQHATHDRDRVLARALEELMEPSG
jgi:hypothetical protein